MKFKNLVIVKAGIVHVIPCEEINLLIKKKIAYDAKYQYNGFPWPAYAHSGHTFMP